jgi:hypothetical protein
MMDTLEFDLHIEYPQQGTYFTHPFQIPENVERFTLAYQYLRRPEKEDPVENGCLTEQSEENIVDLGLLDPTGYQVGASGSDKREIVISEVDATPGYLPCKLKPGEWRILIGAYKISPEGVTVHYRVQFTYKSLRLLKGDLHVHTLASDGVHSVEELAVKAARNGLDFIAITDHNQFSKSNAFPSIPGVTILPGVEWTHYQGHANFIGSDKPYDSPFFCNTQQEVLDHFKSARERGALITINHPFEEVARFQLDWTQLPFDCIEVWNGPMRESNLRAIGLWHQLLINGRKVPISAGSDYHRDTPFIFLGGPTYCAFSLSNSTPDILDSVRQGHGYITFSPQGPLLNMTAGSAIMGDSIKWPEINEVEINAEGLVAGDSLRLITQTDQKELLSVKTDGRVSLVLPIEAPGFIRIEILRSFLPGLPMLPSLISNPIYIDA